MGEGGAREKGDTRGELYGEDAVLSSALEKMKAVSVRLRWYRLNGFPGRESLSVLWKLNPNFTPKNFKHNETSSSDLFVLMCLSGPLSKIVNIPV